MSKTADEARKSATEQSAAYQQVNTNPIGPNNYTDENNPELQLLGASADPINKQIYFQNLYRGLVGQPSPTGAGNLWDYTQTLLRSTGFSKGKTAIGIADPKDVDGLIQAIGGAIGTNANDVVSYLQAIAASGGRGKKEVKQPDTTTKFTRQVTTALRLKDLGDATNTYNNAFFLAYGAMPNQDNIKSFQDAWNREVKLQNPTTVTKSKIQFAKVYDKTSDPVMDKKTGKQKVDKFGNLVFSKQKTNKDGVLQYETITTSGTTTTGEDFTAEEQAEFMADYLVANFPDIKDAENLGGSAKVIYDSVVNLYKNNYQEVPNFSQVAPIIKDVIGSGKAEVGQEYLRQAQEKVRKQVSKQYMSIADSVAEGQNASEIINPLLDKASAAFEESVNINDPFMKMVLNYQASDGTYRLPNEYELTNLIMKDSRSKKTSGAINNAVDLIQRLKSRLG